MSSFTHEYSRVVDCIVISCGVRRFFPGNEDEPFLSTNAIIDTGAKMTVLSERLARKIGLIMELESDTPETGVSYVTVHTIMGNINKRLYEVDFQLPGDSIIHAVNVYEGALPDDVDILIGMDILSLGTLAISNTNGHTTLSFQIPSTSTIDLTQKDGCTHFDNVVTPLSSMTNSDSQRRPWWRIW